MLPIQHAARALGVPDHELGRLASQGGIPGAVDREGEWLIPTASLVSVARQQGWTLDLAALQHHLEEQSLTRYSGDALAAQAAVLLARTQATAARVESRDLLRRLRETTASAAADRSARREAEESIAGLREQLEAARRDQAVAEAQLTELRARLNGEGQQLHFMVDRINNLEEERRQLTRSLGWFGRFRYRRLVEREQFESTPAKEDPALTANPVLMTSTGDHLAPVAAIPPAPTSPSGHPPDVGLPVWDVNEDETAAGRDHLDEPRPDMAASAVERPSQAPDAPLARTADGRFERSALIISRPETTSPSR